MELDDLKVAWQALDRRFEQQWTLSLEVVRDGKLEKVRRGLHPLWLGQIAKIVFGICLMLLFGRPWVAYRGIPHLMIPALAIHVYGLIFVILGARTIALIARVDYAAPVIQIQRQLAELQRWRARVAWPLLAMAGCLMWIPMMLLAFEGSGSDLWVVNPKFVYWNIATGFLLVALLYGLLRWTRTRGRDLTGGGVRKAQQELDKIARFEKEWP